MTGGNGMEVIYEILYKNGIEDTQVIRINQSDQERLDSIENTIESCFQDDTTGYINMGGMIVRLSDVSRIKITTRED